MSKASKPICLPTRERLLDVADILINQTDENTGLTAKEIAAILKERHGVEPAELSVLEDLHSISSRSFMGMRIASPRRGEKTGFRCVEKIIGSEEALLLINMVRTCKFITQEQRDDLCESLYQLVSAKKQDEAVDVVYVDEREADKKADVFQSADIIAAAIRNNETVSFHYRTKLMNGGYSDAEIVGVVPVALIFSFGYYYLETFAQTKENSEGEVMYRRLDRVFNVTPGKRVNCGKTIKQLRKTVSRDVSRRFDMLGDGVCRTLFLRVKGTHARYVYDRFGKYVQFRHIDEKTAIGYVSVEIQLSKTFYRWLFGMGDGVVLQRPSSLSWIREFPKLQNTDDLAREHLVADYMAAVQGMKDQLEVLSNLYNAI